MPTLTPEDIDYLDGYAEANAVPRYADQPVTPARPWVLHRQVYLLLPEGSEDTVAWCGVLHNPARDLWTAPFYVTDSGTTWRSEAHRESGTKDEALRTLVEFETFYRDEFGPRIEQAIGDAFGDTGTWDAYDVHRKNNGEVFHQ